MKHTLHIRCYFCKNAMNTSAKNHSSSPIRICRLCMNLLPPDSHRCRINIGTGTPKNPKRRCKKWIMWGKKVCATHKSWGKSND